MYKRISNGHQKSVIIILFLYIFFVFSSYCFVKITGMYNGDHLGNKPSLTNYELLLNLFYGIIPFLILFLIYKIYKKKKYKLRIFVPKNFFGIFLFLLLFFQIMVSVLYGVGRMGQEAYQAPAGIKLFIQLSNRFNARFGVCMYILLLNKKNVLQYILLIMLIVQSFLYFSLGVFPVLGLLFILKYDNELLIFIKKKIFIVIIGILVLPLFVTTMYDFRNTLRTSKKVESDPEMATISVAIFGRLLGRMSSYSASSVVMERKDAITKLVKDNFSIIEYPKEALGVFIKNIFPPKHLAYGHLLYGEYSSTSQSLLGIPGSLMVGHYYSFFGLVVNISTIFFLTFIIFELSSIFYYNKFYELIFMFLCMMGVSGASSELMFFFQNILVYSVFFLVINFFCPKNSK